MAVCGPENNTEDVLDFTVSDIDVPEVCLKGIRVLDNVPDLTTDPAHPPQYQANHPLYRWLLPSAHMP